MAETRPETADWRKWLHELKREDAHRAHDRHRELIFKLMEATFSSAQLGLRTAILVNGGAAIAVLTLVGGLVGQGRIKVDHLDRVNDTLMWFAAGIACAGLAMAGSYLANYAHSSFLGAQGLSYEHPWVVDNDRSKRWWWATFVIQIVTITIGLASVVCFIFGTTYVKHAITGLMS
jgi:hypothetical protein